MSTNITKFGIRAKLYNLNGKSPEEVLEYFAGKGFHLEDPEEDFESYPVFKEGFHLKDSVNKTYPIRSGQTGEWGIEHLYYYSTDGNEKGSTSKYMETIYEDMRVLETEYDVDIEQIIIFSYTYYNGGDEPISFHETK